MLPTFMERLTLSKNVPSAENMFTGFADVDEGLVLLDVLDDAAPELGERDSDITARKSEPVHHR